MKKMIAGIVLFIFSYAIAETAEFKDSVDLADLSQLSSEALETFKDMEFKVFLTKIEHARAKAKVRKAEEALKAAKLALDSKKLHLKAAESELKEAKAASDQAKIAGAEKTLKEAKKTLEAARILVKWKEKEVDISNAYVGKARVSISVSEAERQLIWATRLKEQKVPEAAHYIISELKTKLENKQKDFEEAVSKEKKKITEANKLKADYEKLFK
jgi:hypothetical protein